MPSFKIIVIGDSCVGKTCLTYRFCENKFPPKTEATIGLDIREKTITIDNEPIKLIIWDTAGQERFRQTMVQHYYRHTDAIVLVYDMTKIETFKSLHYWLDECKDQGIETEKVPRILVGNKCDRVDEIAVSHNMAMRLADRFGMPFFETSAHSDAENDNVNAIFMTLALKLKDKKTFMMPRDSSIIKINSSDVPVQTNEGGGWCCWW